MAFIRFNDRVINTNFITTIWKTEETHRTYDKVYLIRVQLHQVNGSFRETYVTEEERDEAFENLINEINNK